MQAQSTPLVGAIHRDPELWASISAEPTNNSENNNLGELACTPSGSGGNCPVLGGMVQFLDNCPRSGISPLSPSGAPAPLRFGLRFAPASAPRSLRTRLRQLRYPSAGQLSKNWPIPPRTGQFPPEPDSAGPIPRDPLILEMAKTRGRVLNTDCPSLEMVGNGVYKSRIATDKQKAVTLGKKLQ